MNVTSPEPQACTPAGATGAARDSNPGHTLTDADAAAYFVGLLTQAAAATPASPAAAATALPQAAADADEGDSDTAPVDWVMPFLAPQGPPIPLDLELPPPTDAGEAGPLAGISTGSSGGTFVPLPVLIPDPGAGKDFGLASPGNDPSAADASASAAVMTGPRVEATGNGAVQTVVRHVTVPVGDGRWSEHVGHEVRLLVERGVQGATLRLTPEHLGPVDVRIDIVNDKANVVFSASQADTRTALTEAIPKLREMFAGAGLTLGDAGVRQDVPGRFAGSSPRPSRGDFAADAGADEPLAAVQSVRLGLVDAYA